MYEWERNSDKIIYIVTQTMSDGELTPAECGVAGERDASGCLWRLPTMTRWPAGQRLVLRQGARKREFARV